MRWSRQGMLPGPLRPEPCPPGPRCSPPPLFGHPPCQALGLQPWVGSCGVLQASSVSSPWPPPSVETPLLLWLKPLSETAEAIPQIQMTGLQAARGPALSLAQTQACVTGGGLTGLGIPPGETSPSLPPTSENPEPLARIWAHLLWSHPQVPCKLPGGGETVLLASLRERGCSPQRVW